MFLKYFKEDSAPGYKTGGSPENFRTPASMFDMYPIQPADSGLQATAVRRTSVSFPFSPSL